MILRIEKELFQWEKGRYVFIDTTENDPQITCIQFYNKKSKYAPESQIVDGKALIPNHLLKENLPIVALACIENAEGIQVISRKVFKVLARTKPEFYIDDDNSSKEIIYDGGVEL